MHNFKIRFNFDKHFFKSNQNYDKYDKSEIIKKYRLLRLTIQSSIDRVLIKIKYNNSITRLKFPLLIPHIQRRRGGKR